MASERVIDKMKRMIVAKRRELGLAESGMVPVEEVIRRINSQSENSSEEYLAQDMDELQNNNGDSSSRF